MSDIVKTRFTLETDLPDDGDVLRALNGLWGGRRTTAWRVTTEPAGRRAITHPTRHECTLTRVTAGERDGAKVAVARLALDVETAGGEDPTIKARRILDLPHEGPRHGRATAGEGVFGVRSNIDSVVSDKIIGLMPRHWLSEDKQRRITDYSHSLGSYGQGGVGMSGWQINGGSWLFLPLKHSDGWITLTHEESRLTADRQGIAITIDQRIIGVHPDQRPQFHPWEHNYGGHERIDDMPDWSNMRPVVRRFSADADGFVLEAGDNVETWRFEISPQLPRPIFAGSKEPRELYAGEDVGANFQLAHDCYIDV